MKLKDPLYDHKKSDVMTTKFGPFEDLSPHRHGCCPLAVIASQAPVEQTPLPLSHPPCLSSLCPPLSSRPLTWPHRVTVVRGRRGRMGFSSSRFGAIVVNFVHARSRQRQLMPSSLQTRWVDIQTKKLSEYFFHYLISSVRILIIILLV